MNNAKMWLVVPPAVGVPVFLGAVAVGSFAVHVAVLSNTTWVSDFLSGATLGSGGAQASATLFQNDAETTAKASYVVPAAAGDQQVLVILPDGTTTTALLRAQDGAAPAVVLDH